MSVADHINGIAPPLSGSVCQAFICQQFFADGRLEDEANVIFLRFDDTWFRLYFEPGLIFWRSGVPEPHPWEVPEERWVYSHVDLGKAADIIGQKLTRYDMVPTNDSTRVSFEFSNGRHIIVAHEDDCGRYVVA